MHQEENHVVVVAFVGTMLHVSQKSKKTAAGY